MTAEPPTTGETAHIPPPVTVRNEFSLVEVGYVPRGKSLSLVVTDSLSGSRIVLDATELESLARAPHESFRRLLREVDEHGDENGDQPGDEPRGP